MGMVRNPFHLVEYSPWPLVGSLGAFFLTVGFASWFHGYGVFCCCVGVFLILLTIVQWWRDIIREATYQGLHTGQVSVGLRWGIILFIVSEVCFFFGSFWPPVGLEFLNPFSVPLLNTAVLLASGVRVTWAHHSFIEKDRSGGIFGLSVTVLLGGYFTFLQGGEYFEAAFRLRDGVFGSVFFVATGFHGLHVLIGSSFLFVCLYRVVGYHFSGGHHFVLRRLLGISILLMLFDF